MKNYFFKVGNTWFSCKGVSRTSVLENLGNSCEVLTEKQAQSRSETDQELRKAVEAAAMCDLMCG